MNISGPNSIPNGDTTVMRGHANEKFVCTAHRSRNRGRAVETMSLTTDCPKRNPKDDDLDKCHVLPLRWYLEQNGMLRTGKTK